MLRQENRYFLVLSIKSPLVAQQSSSNILLILVIIDNYKKIDLI